jgi:hypothetical protein
MKRLLMILVALVVLVPMVVEAQTTTMPVTYTWTAPTTGSAVHHYIVQTSANLTAWTTLTAQPATPVITIPAAVGVNIQIRVAGVDAQGRQGLWSDPSIPFVLDAGAPGVSGTPIRVP